MSFPTVSLNSPTMETSGAQGISDTPYAQRTRELIKLITQLRGVGAQVSVALTLFPSRR